LSAPVPSPAPASPFKNPSYPQRTHTREKAHWQSVLAHWEARIAEAARKLESLGNHADRPAYHRLHVQMLGARDQIADAVRRLPGEAGALYDEDKHKVDLAVAALERIFQKWR
jgi:hypothetical protein